MDEKRFYRHFSVSVVNDRPLPPRCPLGGPSELYDMGCITDSKQQHAAVIHTHLNYDPLIFPQSACVIVVAYGWENILSFDRSTELLWRQSVVMH